MQRRTLIQAAAVAAPFSAIVGAGLLPGRLRAAWPTEAFNAESLSDAERLLFGGSPIEDSDRIMIEAPDIAENGRVVPIDVRIELPEPASLTLLSDANPFPFLARAYFTPAVSPRLSMRVKMGGSGNVIAIVDAGGGLHRAMRPIKVTSGGCGG
jgi:sulfur-oxidizing protein SoxY